MTLAAQGIIIGELFRGRQRCGEVRRLDRLQYAPSFFARFTMRPTVIALTGLPGTGKSKLGATLYQCLPRDFVYLDIDTLTQPLVRAALTVNRLSLATAAENGYLRKLRDAQYSCLLDQVRELVSFERSVLFIAPMTHELEDPPGFLRVVASLGPARFILIRTHASPEAVRTSSRAARRFSRRTSAVALGGRPISLRSSGAVADEWLGVGQFGPVHEVSCGARAAVAQVPTGLAGTGNQSRSKPIRDRTYARVMFGYPAIIAVDGATREVLIPRT